MINTPMIDRETYRKMKKMSREEMQAFLVRYADSLLEDKDERTILTFLFLRRSLKLSKGSAKSELILL